jgi:hypothetical protein
MSLRAIGQDNMPAFDNSIINSDLDVSLFQETIPFTIESGAPSGLTFINSFTSEVNQQYRNAVVAAEADLQSKIADTVTFHVAFNFKPLNGFSGSNSFPVFQVSYADFKAALTKHATTIDDFAAVASLPSIDPTNGAGFAVPDGLAQILGLASASNDIDDTVTLNSKLPWTYGADAVGVIEHELTEGLMGRIGGLGLTSAGNWGPLDLFRYSSPGLRDYSGGADGRPAYFSVDGAALLVKFHNAFNNGRFDGQDFGDWEGIKGDAFGPGGPGSPGQLTATDLRVLDILGWTPTTSSTPPGTATPLAGAVVSYLDTTTNQRGSLVMDTAPTSGAGYLKNQYIYAGSDNVVLSTQAPNVFIHSGSGNDAIQVATGRNVVDGGLGSNFLTGGTGQDTFFTDARRPGAVWNTIRNFHAGDAATLWGFANGVSSYRWDTALAGAAGSQGATLRANVVGGAGRTGNGIDASITFAGLSLQQARSLQITTGTQTGGTYLYIYNPGV